MLFQEQAVKFVALISFLLLSPNNALPGWYSPVKVARVLVVPIKGLGLWIGTA